MATATRTRAKARTKSIVAPEDFLRIGQFLTTRVLVERDLEVRIINLAALSGVNVHQLGAPGIAKSLGLREYARCITGTRFFEKVLSAGMPPDAVIGGYDMPKFTSTGEFTRNVEHHAPNAHVVFLDEIFRANGPTLDAILPMMNTEERAAEFNGGMMQTPIMFVVTASNHMPDPDDAQRQALVDRVTLMQMVADVKQDDSFKEIFRRHHSRRQAQEKGSWERETITVEQLMAAQAQVNAVELSTDFLDKAAELRRQASDEGLTVSPRRWMEIGRVCRAQAWMSGRDVLTSDDLAVAEHGLWRHNDEIPIAHKLVMPFHGRFEREATTKRQEAAAPLAEVEQIRSQVEGTPPNEELEQDVLTRAISASRKLDGVKARVDKVLEEADKERKDASTLRELSNELLAVQMWFKKNSLPTSYDGPVD